MPNGGNGAVRQRINFSKIPTVIKIPNLIEVQRRSYERFLQMNLSALGTRGCGAASRL